MMMIDVISACQVTNLNKENEFLCLDLSYISALLSEGFGFPKDTRLHVRKIMFKSIFLLVQLGKFVL